MIIHQLYNIYSQHYLVDTDTRKIRKNTIFFALKGNNFNGNTFAKEALNKGASYSVVDEEEHKTHDNIILVDDVLTALQKLATYHRKQLSIPIIGLTGSNGKTTTKELTQKVLSKKFTTTATLGNLNNHIGVPLTLLSMTPKTEIGIVEMGANHPKEIAFLCTIAQPDYGYITNFGKAHLEGFGSLEGVVKAKSELYDYLQNHQKVVFVNPLDKIQLKKTSAIKRVLFEKSIKLEETNPFVTLRFHQQKIQSNLIGSYNFNNITAAITIGNYFKVTTKDIVSAIESYIPQNNRSQIIKTAHNTIILDAYNANPSSVSAAIESFSALASKNKVLILGDMFELGENSIDEHQLIADLVTAYSFKEVYFVGENFHKINTKFTVFKTFKNLQNHLKQNPIYNQSILIKGSRGMALERLVKIID